MLLLLELHVLLRLADGTVLLHALYVLLPADTLLVLLMKTHGTQAVARLLTVHGEDCALSSWHMGRGYGFLRPTQEKLTKSQGGKGRRIPAQSSRASGIRSARPEALWRSTAGQAAKESMTGTGP